LRNIAAGDREAELREIALQQIAAGWPDHPETLPLLQKIADSEDYWTVRQVVVKAVAALPSASLEVFAWLQKLAESDRHLNVRETAVEEIARRWCKSGRDAAFPQKAGRVGARFSPAERAGAGDRAGVARRPGNLALAENSA
jgi:hypothetical protein